MDRESRGRRCVMVVIKKRNNIIETADNKSRGNIDMQLLNKYRDGDTQAKWDLLHRFNPLIQRQTSRFSNVLPKPVVEAKLKQYTIQAFDTFDPNSNAKLSTHVVNYMQQINRANYKNQQAIRLPENYAINFSKFQKAKAELDEKYNREPSDKELATTLGWSIAEVGRAKQRYHEEHVEGKNQFEFGVHSDDTAATTIRFTYDTLTPIEKKILEYKTGYNDTKVIPVGEIYRKLKLTPSQFNRHQQNLISKLGDVRTNIESL